MDKRASRLIWEQTEWEELLFSEVKSLQKKKDTLSVNSKLLHLQWGNETIEQIQSFGRSRMTFQAILLLTC